MTNDAIANKALGAADAEALPLVIGHWLLVIAQP
jgi:hypothetical protein